MAAVLEQIGIPFEGSMSIILMEKIEEPRQENSWGILVRVTFEATHDLVLLAT